MLLKERAEKLRDDFRTAMIANQHPDLVKMIVDMLIEMQKDAVSECTAHPKYNAKRTPRTTCEGCWRYYINKKDRVNKLED